MSRLVSGVIDAARDWSPTFNDRAHPPGPLYRQLAHYCQRLQGKIIAVDPSLSGLETTLSYQLPLADHDAGLALGSTIAVTEVLAVDPSTAQNPGTNPIALIHRDQRHAPNGPALAAWQEGERLYLRGPASRWGSFTGTVQVRVAEPISSDARIAALQQPNAVLPLPDTCSLAAEMYLAYFMGRRSSPPIDFSDAVALAEADALVLISQRLIGTVVFTADEWQP